MRVSVNSVTSAAFFEERTSSATEIYFVVVAVVSGALSILTCLLCALTNRDGETRATELRRLCKITLTENVATRGESSGINQLD